MRGNALSSGGRESRSGGSGDQLHGEGACARVLCVVFVIASVVLAPGCAQRGFSSPRAAHPVFEPHLLRSTPPDDAVEPGEPADSLVAAPVPEQGLSTPAPRSSRRNSPEGRRQDPATPPVDRPPFRDVPEITAPSETLEVSVELPASEQARLERAARDDLERTETLIARASRRNLSNEAATKLATARGLVSQARDSLERGHAREAASLASKARLLATEATR